MVTKNSGGSHSRRNSLSQNSLAGAHMPSDHILSWREKILDDNSIKSTKASRSDRSVSPGKFSRTSYQSQSTSNSQNNLASAARQQIYAGSTPNQATPSVSTASPPQSIYKATSNNVSQPPTPSFSLSATDDNPLQLDSAGKSYQFWNMSSWKPLVNPTRDPTKLNAEGIPKPPMDRGGSIVSKLSSDDGASGDNEEDESEGEALSCKKCGGKDFRARRVAGRQKLVCTKCSTTVE